MKMKLADQHTALLPLTPAGTAGALLIRAPVITAALREYFELLWDKATPIPGRPAVAALRPEIFPGHGHRGAGFAGAVLFLVPAGKHLRRPAGRCVGPSCAALAPDRREGPRSPQAATKGGRPSPVTHLEASS